MQSIPKEQIIKRHQTLSQTLQDAIFSEKNADTIIRVCALRDIPGKTTFLIGQLTSRVLLGYVRPENFAAEIQKETGVSEMTAQLVAHDIDGEVFSNVRLELKKLYPPIIQTPNIQRPGFATDSKQSIINNQQQIKPKYVISIPEKFMKREAWNVKQEEIKPQTSTPPAKDEAGIENKELRIKNYESEKKETTQIPEKTEIKTTAVAEPEFKPIVPLPTFIRSQFKAPEQTKSGIVNKGEKEFIDKFSAPDPTLAKPETPKTDPYKESL